MLYITFAADVAAVGANIQSDFYGGYTGLLTAFNRAGDELGTVSVDGVASPSNDGSAAFIGISSSASDIASVRFYQVGGSHDGDFAINQVSITTPAPCAVALVGLAGAFGRRRRA
jgi:hypothetical protein